MRKKFLVTGALGQLGSVVVQLLGKDSCWSVDKNEVDLSDNSPIPQKYAGVDCIIHCAAFTAVDKAEESPKLAQAINEGGTRKMAEFAAEQSAKFVYISTDYVYDGTKDGVYEVYDTVNPQSVYGTTKLAGERIVQELIPETHFIIRTSWVFGNSPLQTGNFVKTMIGLSENRKEINVVNDQIGSPTYALDLAKLIVAMIQTDEYGIYHATNEGFCSWYDFACEILKDKQIKINPVSSEQYPTLAVRPKNSRLSKQKLTEHGFTRLASWQDALERYKNTL